MPNISVECLEALSDALGHSISPGLKVPYPKMVVLGGVGLPLRMKFSHSVIKKGYTAVCYKISGKLYIIAAYEISSKVTTVMVLDKGRHTGPQKNDISLYVEKLRITEGLETLDQYMAVMSHMSVGAWFRIRLSEWRPCEV